MKIVSLFSVVEAITSNYYFGSTSQPFYFGTGKGALNILLDFDLFFCFRFLFIDCFRLHHQ
jgi:hypothetical protein